MQTKAMVLPVWALILAAAGPCPRATDGTGTARSVSIASSSDAELIVSMSMAPKLMKIDYQTLAARRLPCRLAHFRVGATKYDLRAPAASAGSDRLALPQREGAPIADLLPINDLLAIAAAAKDGMPVRTSGYLLVTIGSADVTGWRFYDAVPRADILAQDMASALAQDSRLTPIFRNEIDSNRTMLFLPKGQ